MANMALPLAVTERFIASILLPSLPPPPEVVRPTPSRQTAVNEGDQSVSRAGKQTHQNEVKAIQQPPAQIKERITISAEALQLRKDQKGDVMPTQAVVQTVQQEPVVNVVVVKSQASQGVVAASQSREASVAEVRGSVQPEQYTRTPAVAGKINIFA